MKQQGNKEN